MMAFAHFAFSVIRYPFSILYFPSCNSLLLLHIDQDPLLLLGFFVFSFPTSYLTPTWLSSVGRGSCDETLIKWQGKRLLRSKPETRITIHAYIPISHLGLIYYIDLYTRGKEKKKTWINN
ncbi:hypothetical protein GGR50DRAFT_676936, partial [Xylaria sp. CBS 124048]